MRRLRLGDDQPPFQALLLMDSEPGCSFPDLSYLHPGGDLTLLRRGVKVRLVSSLPGSL